MKTKIELPFLTFIDPDFMPDLVQHIRDRGIPVTMTDDLDFVVDSGTISHSYHVTKDALFLVIDYNEA